MDVNSLLALQPQGHLFDVVTFVAGSISLLRIINVEPFRKFCVVAVCTAKGSDGIDVVLYSVELGDIEVFAETEFDKHVLVKVEGVKAGLHGIKCFRSV